VEGDCGLRRRRCSDRADRVFTARLGRRPHVPTHPAELRVDQESVATDADVRVRSPHVVETTHQHGKLCTIEFVQTQHLKSSEQLTYCNFMSNTDIPNPRLEPPNCLVTRQVSVQARGVVRKLRRDHRLRPVKPEHGCRARASNNSRQGRALLVAVNDRFIFPSVQRARPHLQELPRPLQYFFLLPFLLLFLLIIIFLLCFQLARRKMNAVRDHRRIDYYGRLRTWRLNLGFKISITLGITTWTPRNHFIGLCKLLHICFICRSGSRGRLCSRCRQAREVLVAELEPFVSNRVQWLMPRVCGMAWPR